MGRQAESEWEHVHGVGDAGKGDDDDEGQSTEKETQEGRATEERETESEFSSEERDTYPPAIRTARHGRRDDRIEHRRTTGAAERVRWGARTRGIESKAVSKGG